MSNEHPFPQSPLFQLNLMLWLVWYPLDYETSGIRPIFREDGFELQAIGPSLAVPPTLELQARNAGLNVKRSANPDLVLRHSNRHLLLPIECKQNSFGPDVDEAKQAYVLLLLNGGRIANDFGLSSEHDWQSYVCYGVSSTKNSLMLQTLNILTQRLEDANIVASPSGAFGIEITSEKVFVQAVHNGEFPITLLDSSDRIEVVDLEKSGAPNRLYILPLDPSIQMQDEDGRIALERMLRAAIVSSIGSRLDDESFEFDDIDIMRSAIEVWDEWQDTKAKQGLIKFIRKYLRRIFNEMKRKGATIDYHNGEIAFKDIQPKTAENIRKYMTSTEFRQGQIDFIQESAQSGFEDINSEWS